MPEDKNDPLGIAVRQLLAIAGAFSLIGLIKDMLTWQHDVGLWIDAFRAFTRPIVTFLFGWIPAIFNISFPGLAKDYLTVGLVCLSAFARSLIYQGASRKDIGDIYDILGIAILVFVSILLWPIVLLLTPFWYFISSSDDNDRKAVRVFASVFIYFAVIIAINYGLVAGGARAGS